MQSELSMQQRALNILKNNGALVGLIILCVIFSFASDIFFSTYNLINISRQSAVNIVLAVGMTLVIISGGIDLSLGAVLAFVGTVTADLLVRGTPMGTALIVGVVIGIVFGLFNGFLVTKAKIPPFIATLGTMVIARSLGLIYSGGLPKSGLPESFKFIGAGNIAGIPMPVVITIVVFLLGLYAFNKTKIGRYAYAIGGNEEATYLSGINIHKWKIVFYGIHGLLCAVAGIILASRMNSGQPTVASGLELDIIASVVIGGTSLAGGQGRLMGSLYGALIITVLNNGLNLLNVSPYYQGAIIGFVILAAVWLERRQSASH